MIYWRYELMSGFYIVSTNSPNNILGYMSFISTRLVIKTMLVSTLKNKLCNDSGGSEGQLGIHERRNRSTSFFVALQRNYRIASKSKWLPPLAQPHTTIYIIIHHPIPIYKSPPWASSFFPFPSPFSPSWISIARPFSRLQ